MKDFNDDDPATKYVKRRQEEDEDEEPLPWGWFVGIGVGIVLAIGGVILWLLYR